MSNQVRLGSTLVQTLANGKVTDGIMFFYPGFQASTDTTVLDKSGRDRHMLSGADLSTAELWSVSNAYSTTAGTSLVDKAVRITRPTSDFYDYNLAHNFLFHTRILGALPSGASRTIFAIGQASQTSGFHGFRMFATVEGYINLGVDHASGLAGWGATDAAGNNKIAFNGTDWYSLTAAVWAHDLGARTARFYVWINGINAYTSSVKGITSIPTSIISNQDVRIGGRKNDAGQYQGLAASYQFTQAYYSPNTVVHTQETMQALAKRLHRMPSVMLTDDEWPMS